MMIVAALALMIWVPVGAAGEVAVASGHPEYPPIMWKDGNAIIGVGPDIVKRAFGELGIKVDCRFAGNWAQVQEAQKKGDVDVLVGVYVTEGRRAVMEYSVPYAQDPVVVFTARGNTFAFRGWDDLIGKKGTTTTGDSYGQAFDAFMAAKLNVERSATVKENFDRILSGKADYFVFSLYSGLFEAGKLNLSGKIEYLKEPVTVESFHISIGKKSKYLSRLPEINRTIERMIKEGAVARLTEEYTKRYEASVLATK
jgi:polar amino acid transport system substrate-binding protein